MTEELRVVHGGIEIRYDEDRNRWRFELDGKERNAESLINAKAAIDAPERKAKSKFTPIDVWWDSYGSWKATKITSVTDSRYGDREAWIVAGVKRQKVPVASLFAGTPENAATIAGIRGIEKQHERLREEAGRLKATLKRVELPKDE